VSAWFEFLNPFFLLCVYPLFFQLFFSIFPIFPFLFVFLLRLLHPLILRLIHHSFSLTHSLTRSLDLLPHCIAGLTILSLAVLTVDHPHPLTHVPSCSAAPASAWREEATPVSMTCITHRYTHSLTHSLTISITVSVTSSVSSSLSYSLTHALLTTRHSSSHSLAPRLTDLQEGQEGELQDEAGRQVQDSAHGRPLQRIFSR
jgi:hypothetical protein